MPEIFAIDERILKNTNTISVKNLLVDIEQMCTNTRQKKNELWMEVTITKIYWVIRSVMWFISKVNLRQNTNARREEKFHFNYSRLYSNFTFATAHKGVKKCIGAFETIIKLIKINSKVIFVINFVSSPSYASREKFPGSCSNAGNAHYSHYFISINIVVIIKIIDKINIINLDQICNEIGLKL